jgi:hypothetical protein
MQLIHPVAIKPFIKKYIGHRLPVSPFTITKTNKYGIFLYNCLSKPGPKMVRSIDPEIIDLDEYSDTLEVSISENYWQKKGGCILSQKQLDFNKLIEYDFHEEFFKYVSMRIGKKGSINSAIMSFRESFDICEDELSFKTIQRAFQREQARVTAYQSA